MAIKAMILKHIAAYQKQHNISDTAMSLKLTGNAHFVKHLRQPSKDLQCSTADKVLRILKVSL